MTQPIHILTQAGVLNSFSITKKVTENYVQAFYNKHKKSGKSDEQIGELLKKKIYKEIQRDVINLRIPGLLSLMNNISPQNKQEASKQVVSVNKIVSEISKAIIKKKYDKLLLCYLVNSLVNLLGLTEEDFEKFHQQVSSDDSDESSDD